MNPHTSLAAHKGAYEFQNMPVGLRDRSLDRLSKNREEEEENTITFRLKCIVIA